MAISLVDSRAWQCWQFDTVYSPFGTDVYTIADEGAECNFVTAFLEINRKKRHIYEYFFKIWHINEKQMLV